MDQLIEVVEEHDELQFLVSLDYSSNDADLYSCSEWADLYTELGEYDNNPLILDGDPDHHIWNMFAGSTYSAYAFIDHHMVIRYLFDMPNLYDFEYTYIPSLINAMYGCTDSNACNYDVGSVYDDGSCNYDDECNLCEDVENQLTEILGVSPTIHIDPVQPRNPLAEKVRSFLGKHWSNDSRVTSYHDIRIVDTENHHVILFGINVNPGMSQGQIIECCNEMEESLTVFSRYEVSIKVSHPFQY